MNTSYVGKQNTNTNTKENKMNKESKLISVLDLFKTYKLSHQARHHILDSINKDTLDAYIRSEDFGITGENKLLSLNRFEKTYKLLHDHKNEVLFALFSKKEKTLKLLIYIENIYIYIKETDEENIIRTIPR